MKNGPRTDPGTLGDEREWTDARAGRDDRAWLDMRARMDPRGGAPPVREHPDRAGEGQVRMGGADDRARQPRGRRRRNHRRGARAAGRLRVFRVRQERQIAGAGLFDRRDPRDLDVAVPLEGALEARGQLAQLHADTAVRSKKVTRCSSRRVAATAWRRGSRSCGSSVSICRSSLNGALGSFRHTVPLSPRRAPRNER